MYLDCTVKIPSDLGKISRFKKGNVIYIRYTVGRTYHPEKNILSRSHRKRILLLLVICGIKTTEIL